MPGYGILPAAQGRGLLPWDWAVERLRDAKRYWLSSVRPDGRPHAMAVWGCWLEDRFYFSTGSLSRKARNLAADRRCVVTTDRADEAVVVEGAAERVRDKARLARLERAYLEKYSSGYPDDSAVFAVEPRVVFGFIESEGEFSGSATRWSFE